MVIARNIFGNLMQPFEVTPLILSFNERENVTRTVSALAWSDEVVILDSFSSDDTSELAKKAHPNVTVLQRPFDSHAQQWNFGLQQIKTKWVLALDADYELSQALSTELEALIPRDSVSGYEAKFVYRIHGRSLRGSAYPPHVILFRKERGSFYDDGHTQRLRLQGEVLRLNGVVYHDDRKPLTRWLSAQDRYARIEAHHLLSTRRMAMKAQDQLRLAVYFAPAVMFVYLLIIRGLILDGWPGLYYVMQRTIAESLLSLRLLTEKHKLEKENVGN